MTTEKQHTGAWTVREFVTNGRDTWLESRTYYGYNKTQSVANYRATIAQMGWRIAE